MDEIDDKVILFVVAMLASFILCKFGSLAN